MKYLLIILALFNFSGLRAQTKGASPVATTASTTASGSTYAVVIGISDYQDPGIPDLRFADKDAEAFANYLRSEAGGKLDGDHLKVLINSKATMAQFANALDWLWEVCKEGDQAIIYFSGHGDVEKKSLTQPGFLLCWDAPARVYMAGGAFALPMLQEVVSTLSIQNKAKVIVITDACRSGTLAGSSVSGAQATAANLAKQFGNEIKIMSCQPNEYSIEGEQWGGGRGAFSYHLLDALYGMADNNNDLWVTLQEVGRYLEDHVTSEVAPVSQVPMIVGNRNEQLIRVDAQMLASFKSGKASQSKMLAAIDSRGMEDDVLAAVDTTTRELYRLFKKALKDKVFLEPTDACADAFYERLRAEPKMQRLHTTMTRNYAAALQDDAQQAMNIWLAADVQQLECIGKTLKLAPIPRQLQRAAELLGEGHYMYRSLQARWLLFEGISEMKYKNPDEALGRKCLSLFRQSLELEPQSPLPWHRMSQVYAMNLRQPDSAFVCAREAQNLAPNWVLPFADLGQFLSQESKFELAKQALEEAEAIDSLHPYVINRWASWYGLQSDKASKEKAAVLYEQYRQTGGVMYPCWFHDYGLLLSLLGRFAESESQYKAVIALDSTIASPWNSLGSLYIQTRRYAEAETVLKKAIALDSTSVHAWGNLGFFYTQTRRHAEAEPVLKKAIALDSTHVYNWNSLGNSYIHTRRYAEAETVLKKAIAMDSTHIGAWNNLGYLYIQSRRYAEAAPVFKKLIALDSTISPAWNNLGHSYLQARRYGEAEPVLKKAIALDSTNVYAWNNLGHLYIQTRRYAEAEPVLKKAIALDSTFVVSRKNLGALFFRTNRPDEARQNFQKALELNPNYAPAYLGVACLLHSEGKNTEALGYVEQAIGKGITFEQLLQDEDLAPLRATPEWMELMKKHFPDQIKN